MKYEFKENQRLLMKIGSQRYISGSYTEGIITEISPSKQRVKIKYHNGNTAWTETYDIEVIEFLGEIPDKISALLD